MGSVIDMRLPARLRHARDVAVVGELAQADPADAELAVHAARPAALAAPGVLAWSCTCCRAPGARAGTSWPCQASSEVFGGLVLGGLGRRLLRGLRRGVSGLALGRVACVLRLRPRGCLPVVVGTASRASLELVGHDRHGVSVGAGAFSLAGRPATLSSPGPRPSRANGMPKACRSANASSSVLRRGRDRHVEAANLVDLVVVDLGEDDLLADADRVVAAAVERRRLQAAEVADPRDAPPTAGDRGTRTRAPGAASPTGRRACRRAA